MHCRPSVLGEWVALSHRNPAPNTPNHLIMFKKTLSWKVQAFLLPTQCPVYVCVCVCIYLNKVRFCGVGKLGQESLLLCHYGVGVVPVRIGLTVVDQQEDHWVVPL